MNPEVKAKWIAALRSGDYVQGQGALRRGDKYCCLGVLCDLKLREDGQEWFHRPGISTYEIRVEGEDPYCENAELPDYIQEWAGLENAVGWFTKSIGDYDSLIGLNDDAHYTFEQIADVIEEQF